MSDVREDGSEILHYDDPDYPVFCRHNYIPAGINLREWTPNHYHEEVEMIYIEKGRIHHTINDHYVTLNQGEGLFINARQFHELITDEQEDCTLYCLIFNPWMICNCLRMEQRVSRIADNENLEYILLSRECDWQREFIDTMISIVNTSEDVDKSGRVIGELFTLWDVLYNNTSIEHNPSNYVNRDQRMVKQMISFIQNNYKEDIALEQICKSSNVGRTKCTELFKKYVHLTPVDFLRNYRLEKSVELLRDTDMSMAEIAYEVGFSSASYYGEYFKKIIGMTPKHYRNMLLISGEKNIR